MEPDIQYGKKTRLSDKEFEDTIQLAVSTFGKESRTQLLFEEMSELQEAICKFNRGRDTADHVCEEIADVMIMCLQMAHIFGEKEVEKWANAKMLRLYNNLKGGEQ